MKRNRQRLLIMHYGISAIAGILWLVMMLSPDTSLVFDFIFLGYLVCYTIYRAYERKQPDAVVVSKAEQAICMIMIVLLLGKLIFF